MPHEDLRARVIAQGTKFRTSGRRRVIYRDALGRTREATVVGAGTSSGLKLSIDSDSGRIVDNVPLATSVKQASSYVSRKTG